MRTDSILCRRSVVVVPSMGGCTTVVRRQSDRRTVAQDRIRSQQETGQVYLPFTRCQKTGFSCTCLMEKGDRFADFFSKNSFGFRNILL